MTSLEQLQKILEVLSFPAPAQEEYLKRIFHRFDFSDANAKFAEELYLEFDDAIQRARLDPRNELDKFLGPALLRLEEILGSGYQKLESVWSIGALTGEPFWVDVRMLARKALSDLPNRTKSQGNRRS